MKRILDFLRELFRRPSDEELIADGIVPNSRRYDRDLIDAMQREAMGGGAE